MMLLDIGNSAVKWAIQQQGKFTGQGYFVHRDADFAGRAGAAWGELPAQEAAVVANVAGTDMEATLTGWAEANWHVTPEYIRVTPHAAGVTNAYSKPQDLGVDRWAAMIAAYHEYGGPVCVVDCGTAITIDVVDAAGRHHGGLIAPGTNTLKRSLLEDTADVGKSPAGGEWQLTLLAGGTQAAVNNGACYTCSAMIDRVVADVITRFGDKTVLVMTGGDAANLRSLLRRPLQYDPDLVLRGVAILSGNSACAS